MIRAWGRGSAAVLVPVAVRAAGPPRVSVMDRFLSYEECVDLLESLR